MRRGLRRRFFNILRAAFATDDGRAILAGALEDRLAWRPAVSNSFSRIEAPFPNLGRAATPASPEPRPVFITSRFRTGSTLLWNIFRHLDGCTAFYEPLNERRWFDASRRGSRVDRTHRAVEDYWREYDELSDLAGYYNEDWIRRRLYMDERSWDPDLAAYIGRMIAQAPGRPVLQFNRVDFRLAWLRHTFPSATIVHLYRHPRDQWCSTFPDAIEFPKTAPASAYTHHDHYYLRVWADDLKYRFPFLDEQRLRHPYELFYLIWKLSYCFGNTYSDHSLAFEDLTTHPADTLARLFRAVGLDGSDVSRAAALVTPTPSRWHQYADDSWFRSYEERCEDILRDFCGSRLNTLDHIEMSAPESSRAAVSIASQVSGGRR